MSLFKSTNTKKSKKEIRDKKLEVAVAAGASMAVLVLGISILTAFYAKTLMDINYIEESDVYDD